MQISTGLRVLCLLMSLPASAPALGLDCPLRDAPFSVNSPLVDVLLSHAAKAVVDRHTDGSLAKLPPMLAGTQAPTFGAIVTLRSLFTQGFATRPKDESALEAQLGALPVTDDDRAARCARYDDERPTLPAFPEGKLRVLLFEKINGFRDSPSVAAAHAALVAMAARNDWSLFATDNAGVMHPSVLP